MQPTNTIRLLSADKNEKGDLFTRLTSDLFFALGYGDLRYDLAQSGNEIDILGKHRTEPRNMCAECKAHQKKMGGDEVNKFRGALLGEQRGVGNLHTTGYFVSLNGFKQSAIEQEKRHGDQAIIFIDALRIIQELEGGRFLVNDVKATEQAGRCVQRAGLHDIEVEKIELLGHQLGYIKAIHFAHNKQVTHVALIHADGVPLAPEPAQEVIAADKLCGGNLHQLQYLAPAPVPPDMQQLEQLGLAFYSDWIAEECGYMQLDGLPLENQKGPQKPKLEKLFVPLEAELKIDTSRLSGDSSTEQWPEDEPRVYPIGELLAYYKHVALLAAPGGGKSTVLKRLATAYTFRERYSAIKDHLPDEDWLPMFLRCRELRNRTDQPIMQLLEAISTHINMPAEQAEGFRSVLHQRLRTGQVLLLVDGLDEIADEGARKSFADNLRRFLVSYPQVAMVVTSRIAGFRIVAGVIGQVCCEAELAPLTEEGISHLCLQWHLEIGKDSVQEQANANRLTEQILANHSLFTLAQNPLLLTTLLAVRRNIGQLPTNRADLYREAVKLLIRTWNVEGFKPMPEREAMAQLCYVACSMMERDIQQIPHELLLELLMEAREIVASELQYTKTSPEEFIEQIEYRSSLLMRVGQERVGNELQYVYEFRHLTFQEFLAAEGYVKGRHVRRHERLPLVELFEAHLAEPSWEEVISLASVLADEFEAEPLIENLVAKCENLGIAQGYRIHVVAILLGRCLLEEVTISPYLLRKALKQIVLYARYAIISEMLVALWEGRSKEILEEVVEEEYFAEGDNWPNYVAAMATLSPLQVFGFSLEAAIHEVKGRLVSLSTVVEKGLASADRKQQARAAFAYAALCYGVTMAGHQDEEDVIPEEYALVQAPVLRDSFTAMLLSGDAQLVRAATWVIRDDATKEDLLAWTSTEALLITLLLHAWYTATNKEVAQEIVYLMFKVAPLKKNLLAKEVTNGSDYSTFLQAKALLQEKGAHGVLATIEAKAALLIGWYLSTPWSDQELAELIDRLNNLTTDFKIRSSQYYRPGETDEKFINNMLLGLGQAGKEVLKARTILLKELREANPIEPPF